MFFFTFRYRNNGLKIKLNTMKITIGEKEFFPEVGKIEFEGRNSTDPDDLFIAHIAAMDVFARALILSDKILTGSDYKKWRTVRYASFDSGKGAEFEAGKLTFKDLYEYAKTTGELKQISGKQELYEQLLNLYI